MFYRVGFEHRANKKAYSRRRGTHVVARDADHATVHARHAHKIAPTQTSTSMELASQLGDTEHAYKNSKTLQTRSRLIRCRTQRHGLLSWSSCGQILERDQSVAKSNSRVQERSGHFEIDSSRQRALVHRMFSERSVGHRYRMVPGLESLSTLACRRGPLGHVSAHRYRSADLDWHGVFARQRHSTS